jgi:hypothetical protein
MQRFWVDVCMEYSNDIVMVMYNAFLCPYTANGAKKVYKENSFKWLGDDGPYEAWIKKLL